VIDELQGLAGWDDNAGKGRRGLDAGRLRRERGVDIEVIGDEAAKSQVDGKLIGSRWTVRALLTLDSTWPGGEPGGCKS